MTKLIFLLCSWLTLFGAEAAAQACGYSYAKFYVTDAEGAVIRNAQFGFFEIKSNDVAIHSSETPRWVEAESNYFLSEGMCSGHRDVRVKVFAGGFEPIENVIDLPLTNPKNPRIYRIRLKKSGTLQAPSFEHVSHLKGTIYDASGSVVPGVKIIATSPAGRRFLTNSGEEGEYVLELPVSRYDRSANFHEMKYGISFSKEGFQTSNIDFVFIPSQFGAMSLDIGLAIGKSSIGP